MTEGQEDQKKANPTNAVEEDCTGLMEEILDKLKLLNYEKNFLEQKGLKPLNTAYFAIQINPLEQFNYFKMLVKWLIQLNEVQAGDYAKYDDPVTVSQNIQFELKKIGIECDFPPIKLKSGYGDQVCSVLIQLVNRAMKTKKFAYKKPNIQQQTQVEDEPTMEVEGDNLDIADNIEESDDEMEENINEVGVLNEVNEDRQLIEGKVDQKEWILECERVAPMLKYNVKSDAKEWRSHIEQTRTYNDNIKKILPGAKESIEKMSDDLQKVLERVFKREKNINVNMTEKGSEYKVQAEELKQIANRYNALNTSVREKGDEYRNLQEKWEQIQNKTNEHGNNVTDSSPIVKIKTSIQKLRHEIKSMDLRIGVLNHTVLQHKFKEKKQDEDNKYMDDDGGNNYFSNNVDELEEN